MNWANIITIICSVLATLGGFEFVKWLFTRKSNGRIIAAQAESKEIEVISDEFHLLRERLELSDKQLLEKEQRFHEQTILVRELNKQLLDKTNENGILSARISSLEAERAMKLCERRGCERREPRSGY